METKYCPNCNKRMTFSTDGPIGEWECLNPKCKETEPCEACHGTGVEHINDVMIDEPCPECGGEGTQEIDPPTETRLAEPFAGILADFQRNSIPKA